MIEKSKHATVKLWESLIPVLVLISLLALNVSIFNDNATYGPNQIALLLTAAVVVWIGFQKKISWEKMYQGIEHNILSSLQAVVILLLIGSLISAWILCGVVPAMIYYGLEVLSPKVFLVSACVISMLVSLATGSSWSTSGTIGIALLAIGRALGISDGMIVGAIISGAYFGDKMSPLSDTTNLAPAMAGTDLFSHIKYMALTTIPSIVITLIAYVFIGLNSNGQANSVEIDQMQKAIAETFWIHPSLFLVPALVIFLIYKKVPTIPVIFIGIILGSLAAVFTQMDLLQKLTQQQEGIQKTYGYLVQVLSSGGEIITSSERLNELLKIKGMQGMLNTVWLITCAMIFGGVMESTGMLERITRTLIQFAHSFFSLIAATVGSCLFFNITASDQYLAIVVPGKMFAKEYKKRGVDPVNLSRTLEDTGTVTSVLVPWNTCGAYHAALFGVPTLTYLPYCFFNIISPFMTLIFAYFNIRIAHLDEEV